MITQKCKGPSNTVQALRQEGCTLKETCPCIVSLPGNLIQGALQRRTQGQYRTAMVHHWTQVLTPWNLQWDWKMPDVANLECVTLLAPGTVLVFMCGRMLSHCLNTPAACWPEGAQSRKVIYCSSKSSFKTAEHFNICSWKGNVWSCVTGRQECSNWRRDDSWASFGHKLN